MIRETICRHWHLLNRDPIVNKYISNFPQITYKKCRSLKDPLVHSHFQDLSRTSEQEIGMHKSEACDYCNWILEGASFTLSNGDIFKMKFHADCQTKGMLYIVFCRCGPFYIGKTLRNFLKRIYDHIYCIRKNLLYTPIARHVALKHKNDTAMVRFTVLERIMKDPRGGNID